MSLFHRHYWEEVGRTYNVSLLERAARAGVEEMSAPKYATQEAADRDAHGFTNIKLRCSECGDRKVIATVGEVSASTRKR